jgi:hypothetical protein
MAVSLSASAGPGGAGGSVCEGAGSPSSANFCSWPAAPGVISSSQLPGAGAEPERVREAGRRQPEPAGRDLGLLAAEHEDHQPPATQKPSCSRAIA